jgi:alkane 1-monooxygenase
MHWSVYLTTMIFPVVATSSLLAGGAWTWSLVLLSFGLIPMAELFLKPSTVNRDSDNEKAVRDNVMYRMVPQLFVPVQWAVVVLFLFLVSTGALTGLVELAGATASVGICCGVFGINVGHELGHRQSKWERGLAKAALVSSLYVHFFIEHNRGHHRRVATQEDPATSKRGQTVYGFWISSMSGGFRSAWDIAPREMTGLLAVQGVVWGAMVLLAGPLAAGLMAVSAVGGILLLETVNYIEHYGLYRKTTEKGRKERVQPHHSWNSDHVLGRALLFELSRHSDHHAHPGRPYSVLRSFDHAPQFPTGYPGMVLLSLVPPLFFRVMNPLLARWDASFA